MRKDAVLFDLGNTLVRYYEMREFPGILQQSIAEAAHFVDIEGVKPVPEDVLRQRIQSENFEAKDCCVRPLEQRLAHIFGLETDRFSAGRMLELCRAFLGPIFALAHRYDDALPTLDALRERGCRAAIVSNTPWGSPAPLWQEEVARWGLAERVDAVVFCRDCGWRKPDRRVFEYALAKLQAVPEQCVFVGDDPRWDIAGPKAVGIDALLIDRQATAPTAQTLTTLQQLLGRVG